MKRIADQLVLVAERHVEFTLGSVAEFSAEEGASPTVIDMADDLQDFDGGRGDQALRASGGGAAEAAHTVGRLGFGEFTDAVANRDDPDHGAAVELQQEWISQLRPAVDAYLQTSDVGRAALEAFDGGVELERAGRGFVDPIAERYTQIVGGAFPTLPTAKLIDVTKGVSPVGPLRFDVVPVNVVGSAAASTASLPPISDAVVEVLTQHLELQRAHLLAAQADAVAARKDARHNKVLAWCAVGATVVVGLLPLVVR